MPNTCWYLICFHFHCDANKLIDKTGATEGFRAYMAVIPSKQLGIIVLLNKYISNGAIVNAGRKIIFEKS